jgi:hypothetical protein
MDVVLNVEASQISNGNVDLIPLFGELEAARLVEAASRNIADQCSLVWTLTVSAQAIKQAASKAESVMELLDTGVVDIELLGFDEVTNAVLDLGLALRNLRDRMRKGDFE